MPKQYKIKRYHRGTMSGKAKPHPVAVALTVLALAGLVFIGISIYKPIYDTLMGWGASAPEPSSSSSGEQSSAEEPSASSEPAPEPKPEEPLRAIYLPPAVIRDEASLEQALAGLSQLSGKAVNTVMVDLKDQQGNILFKTTSQKAAAYGVVDPEATSLPELAQTLAAKQLGLAVRLSAFQDEKAARAGRNDAVHYQQTEMLWLDNAANAGGKPWLNPYSEGAREYLYELSLEAAEAGARLVVWDNVCFPPNSTSVNAGFGPGSAGVTREQILGQVVREAEQRLGEQDCEFGVYLPVRTLGAYDLEIRYGGNPLLMMSKLWVLGALPGESAGVPGLTVPAGDAAGELGAVLDYGRAALEQAGKQDTRILPLTYGATVEQLAERIGALEDRKQDNWMLYSQAGVYPPR